MDSSKIKAIIIVVFSAFAALYLGVAAATAQMEAVLWIVGGVGLTICLLLGRRIWLLVIVLGAMNIPLIRGFGTTELGYATFLGFSMIMFLMRRLPAKIKFTELELWMLILFLMIVQVYVRNPVGLSMFGGSNVGGKPYFLAGLAFMTGVFLCGYRVETKDLKWAMYLDLGFKLIGGPIGELRASRGMAAHDAAQFGADEKPVDPEAATRNGALGGIAVTIARWVASRRNPLISCFHPFWGFLILLSLALAAASGFRNSIAMVGMYYLLALAYRGGFLSVLISSVALVLLVAGLSIVNVVSPLPPNIQRALTIFPGTWEERYKLDAEGSTEWRVEMWKEAILTDRWIQNKWLGDGLGMTAEELRRSQELQESRSASTTTGLSIHQENAMINGDYHSGPVQTIRIVGYVGLAVLLAAMARLAVHAHRLIQRCRNTEWFPLSLYYGIPWIASPFFFVFVIGDFGTASKSFFIAAAFMRLLENNLPVPELPKRKREPYVLMTHRSRGNMPQPG